MGTFVEAGALLVMVIVGTAVSKLRDSDAAVLLLPPASWAAPAATLTVAVPWAVGVNVPVKTVFAPVVKPVTAPLLSVRSETSKSATLSVKVNVTGIGELVFAGADEVIVKVG